MAERSTIDTEHRFFRLSRNAAIGLIVVVLFVALVVLKPAAPKTIVLLTGPEGSGYHTMGHRIADLLNGKGLATEVRITSGGFDNVKQLSDGAEDTIAFAPSNIEHVLDAGESANDLVTLGSIAYEPLWLFHRSDIDVRRIPDLAGLIVATGAPGTVVNHVARNLLDVNNISDRVRTHPPEDQSPAAHAEALIEGRIDALFAMGSPNAPVISKLLEAENVGALSFERAEAYQALDPGIAKILAPEGVFDLARNVPPADIELLAATTNLVTLDSLYPGVAPLLLKAAATAREQQTFVSARTVFPSSDFISLPLHRGAERYFSQGEKGLSRILPYKVTRWLNHLGFVVLPLLTLTVVIIKIIPMILKIVVNIQLSSLFKKLEAVEKAHASGEDREKLLADLDVIDTKSAKLFVPRSTVHDYVDFRQFLHDMRERVDKA